MASQNMGAGNIARDDYTYSTAPISIPVGQTVSLSIQIEADSDFEILKRMIFAGLDDDIAIPLTIQITDTGSGRDLLNTPAMVGNVCGTAKLPYILQQTKIFSARSVIAITLANVGANQLDNVQVSFGGRKIFGARQY